MLQEAAYFKELQFSVLLLTVVTKCQQQSSSCFSIYETKRHCDLERTHLRRLWNLAYMNFISNLGYPQVPKT